MKRVVPRLLTCVALAATCAVIAPLTARSGTGEYLPVSGTCFFNGRIVVTGPSMSPEFSGAIVFPDGTIEMNPAQTVEYQPHVARWSGSAWVWYASGAKMRTDATQQGGGFGSWFNVATGEWHFGSSQEIPIRHAGYYKLYATYTWYPRYGYGGGSFTAYTPWLSQSSYMGWNEPYCQYV